MTNPLINPPYGVKNAAGEVKNVQTAFDMVLDIRGSTDLEIAINYYILKFLLSQGGGLDNVHTVHFARFQFWSPASLSILEGIADLLLKGRHIFEEVKAEFPKGGLPGQTGGNTGEFIEAVLAELKKDIEEIKANKGHGLPFFKKVSLITAFDGNFSNYIVDFSQIIYPRFNFLLPFANIPDDVVPVQKNVWNFLKLMQDHQNVPISFSSNYPALTLVQVIQNAKRAKELAKMANG